MKVGDKVWYQPNDPRRGNGKYIEISKIGRKYFYIGSDYSNMKCELWDNNGYAFGTVVEYPYGAIYKNEEDYLCFKEWNSLNFNQNITREQKDAIVKIMKGK